MTTDFSASRSAEASPTSTKPGPANHFDVLFIGAGISGIGGAYHLRRRCPNKTMAILDDHESFGGTWMTHRYPGIRSDSDMYTFGFSFKPWIGAPIAKGAEILEYLGDVIRENCLEEHIRYRHKVLTANWSTETSCWTVEGVRTDTGSQFVCTANFLWMGQGYYRHDQGHTPDWPTQKNFSGQVVHSQQWPAELELAGKRIIVIGSGATAATLVPALADRCSHVTMLQRSPTYFRMRRNSDELADLLRGLDVPEEWIHDIVRRKILREQQAFARKAMEEPEATRAELLAAVREHLPSQDLVDRHFTPSYLPFRQRIAYIPEGDLFAAIRSGKVTMVTDEIQQFEEAGIRTNTGQLIPADLIVAATGIELVVMGGIAFTVDGIPVDFSKEVMYRGAMFTGVPNLLWVFGYFRASWTLRVDLLGDFFCQLLSTMASKGANQVTPQLRAVDRNMKLRDWVEENNFNPNYLRRIMKQMPRQGDHLPWCYSHDYWTDRDELACANFEDGALVFGPKQDTPVTPKNALRDAEAPKHGQPR